MPTTIISWCCVIGNALAMFNWKLDSRIKALVVCVSCTMGIIQGNSLVIVHSLNSHLLWFNPRVYSRILIPFYKNPWMMSVDHSFFSNLWNLPRKQGEKSEQPTKGPIVWGRSLSFQWANQRGMCYKKLNIELNMNHIYPLRRGFNSIKNSSANQKIQHGPTSHHV